MLVSVNFDIDLGQGSEMAWMSLSLFIWWIQLCLPITTTTCLLAAAPRLVCKLVHVVVRLILNYALGRSTTAWAAACFQGLSSSQSPLSEAVVVTSLLAAAKHLKRGSLMEKGYFPAHRRKAQTVNSQKAWQLSHEPQGQPPRNCPLPARGCS